MIPEAEAVYRALTEVYRPYVESRLAVLGAASPELEGAIEEGRRRLGETLFELLSLPFERQPRSPLELFQEALEPVTTALAESGAEPARRDPVAVNALPGDLYDLAPASSSQLGEVVWRAHLRWGAAKAAAMTADR